MELPAVLEQSCDWKQLHQFAPLNESDYQHDQGDNQQNMYQSTSRVAGDQSQQPKSHENHQYGRKHVRLLSGDRVAFC